MVMTTKVLISHKSRRAFYSPAAHITAIITFYSSRPSFPLRSLHLYLILISNFTTALCFISK